MIHRFLPIIFYLVLHGILLYALDLRDMPGAAGTETIYKAAIGERKGDETVLVLQWIAHYFDVGPQYASRILSSLCGLVCIISLMICGDAHSKRTSIISGWLGSCWAMSHYFPLMSGADPLAVSCVWLSIGLCWWGASRLSFMGIGVIPLMLGIVLAPLALSIKELALPPLALLLLTPLWIPKWNKNILWTMPVLFYTAYWSYAWMWPDNPTRIQTQTQTQTLPTYFSILESGWKRILDLYQRGIPQGKFDQLILLSGVLLLGIKTKKRHQNILLCFTGIAILLITAYFLGPRTRPRYLTPAALGVLCSISLSISLWKRKGYWILSILCTLFLADTWAYYDVWAQKRTQIVGGQADLIPTPPKWWTQQYQYANDITHRDLSLYGAIDLIDILEQNNGLATMRLRDERHRSLLAFAEITGKKALILDPGACCAGQTVDARCATRIIKEAKDAGYGIVLPTLLKGVERIYPNETRWHQLLLNTLDTWNEEYFWYDSPQNTQEQISVRQEPPCQSKIPFRNPK
jgi:hypothetical protein